MHQLLNYFDIICESSAFKQAVFEAVMVGITSFYVTSGFFLLPLHTVRPFVRDEFKDITNLKSARVKTGSIHGN